MSGEATIVSLIYGKLKPTKTTATRTTETAETAEPTDIAKTAKLKDRRRRRGGYVKIYRRWQLQDRRDMIFNILKNTLISLFGDVFPFVQLEKRVIFTFRKSENDLFCKYRC